MIKKCKTDFVALTDADCVVDKNWLKHLINAFKIEEIIAAGGMVESTCSSNKLQQLLGRELKYRFLSLPRHVRRLPTISLCIRTNYAKKILFDKDLDVAQETDWGYRITKIGKMLFVPKAVVYHYHRTTWKDYFKQQFKYGRFTPILYFKKGHLKRAFGDEISKSYMALQILLIYFGALSLLLGFVKNIFFKISPIFFMILLIIYFIHAIKLSKNFSEFLMFLVIFLVRNIAWCLGIIRGIFI